MKSRKRKTGQTHINHINKNIQIDLVGGLNPLSIVVNWDDDSQYMEYLKSCSKPTRDMCSHVFTAYFLKARQNHFCYSGLDGFHDNVELLGSVMDRGDH